MKQIRSDVVGSLLRPEYLKAARKKYQNGELSSVEATPTRICLPIRPPSMGRRCAGSPLT